jgi:hypothetical protein
VLQELAGLPAGTPAHLQAVIFKVELSASMQQAILKFAEVCFMSVKHVLTVTK